MSHLTFRDYIRHDCPFIFTVYSHRTTDFCWLIPELLVDYPLYSNMEVSINGGAPIIAGWLILENAMKLDDWRLPPWLRKPPYIHMKITWGNRHRISRETSTLCSPHWLSRKRCRSAWARRHSKCSCALDVDGIEHSNYEIAIITTL
jgi:hypothetical protein